MASSSASLSSSSTSSCSPMEQGNSSSKVQHFRLFSTPSKHFVGRIETLYQIHAQLLACSSNSKWSDRTVIIHGPAGIGKTEVARMYAYIFADNPIIKNIAWIDSGNLASLKKSFSSLAEFLGIDIQGKEVKRVVEIIYTYFSDHIGTGLFIFDNAKQMRGTHMEIFNFLPTHYLARRPLILITSRSDKWKIKKQHWISIEGLNEEDAVSYFCKRLSVTQDQENHEEMLKSFKKLAAAMQGFPLGLTLAASNIKDKTSSEIDDMVARLLTNASQSNKDNVNLCMNLMQKALGDEESNLRIMLNILAYLPPDDISVEKVEGIFEYIFKKASRPEDFSALEKCSLISIQNHYLDLNGEKYQSIQISKQVQKRARKRLHSMEETPFYYLTQICEYFCHIKDFSNLEVSTACMHSHLKKLNWPGDSVKYSILFAAKLVSQIKLTSAHGSAWEMVRDVYKFRTDTSIENLPPVREEVIKLLHLCLYFFGQTSTYEENPSFTKTDTETANVEKFLLASVESYIERYLFNAVAHDEKCESNLVEILQNQIIQNLLMKKGHSMRVHKAICNLLLEINPPKIIELQSTLTLYKLLWKYCLHFECILNLVEKLCTLHFQFYAEFYPELNEVEKAMYWEKGPFPYNKLVNLLLKNSLESDDIKWSAKSKFLFLSSFLPQSGGAIMVAHHIEYLSTLNSQPPVEIEFLLQFITCIAIAESCAEALAKNHDVIRYFYKLTKAGLKSKKKQMKPTEFWYKVAWLALLARNQTMHGLLVNRNVYSRNDEEPSSISILIKDIVDDIFGCSSNIPLVITELHVWIRKNRENMKESVTALAIEVFSLWEAELHEPTLKPLLARKNVPGCLLLVAQRIKKYPLLFEPLIKTSTSSEEIVELRKALQTFKNLNEKVNGRVAEREQLLEFCQKMDPKSVVTVGKRRVNKDDLASVPTRRLLFSGQASVINRALIGNGHGGNGGPVSARNLVCNVLILTDSIIFTQDLSGRYHFVSPSYLPGMVMLNHLIIREKAGQNSSLFLVLGTGTAKPEMIEIEVINPSSRDVWVAKIRDAIQRWQEEGDTISDGDEEFLSDSVEYPDMRTTRALEELQDQDSKILSLLRSRSKLVKILRADKPHLWIANNFEGKDEVLASVSHASSEVQRMISDMDPNSVNGVNRSASCVSEHVTSEVLTGLPCRADTFGGFDSQQRLSIDFSQSTNNKVLLQIVVQLADLCGEMFHQMVPQLTPHTNQNQHQLQRRMEDLREAQQRLETEKADWQRELSMQKAEIERKQNEMKNKANVLQEVEKDIIEQREQFYRKLEALQRQGSQGIRSNLDSTSHGSLGTNTEKIPPVNLPPRRAVSQAQMPLIPSHASSTNVKSTSKQQIPHFLANSSSVKALAAAQSPAEAPKPLPRTGKPGENSGDYLVAN